MMRISRYLLGALPALILASGAAIAQTSPAYTGARDLATEEAIDFEGPAVTGELAASAYEVPRPETCDLRDAIPLAPTPYCGGEGGLSLAPGSDGDPDLLALLSQTTGAEDIAWLSVDDRLQEVGRCSPEGLNLIRSLAYNPYSICGRSNTLYAGTGSKIVELDPVVGGVTSDRICSVEDPGESTVEGAESCGVLREFSFDGVNGVGALTFADPPSLGRPVLVASSGINLYFLAVDSLGCGPEVEVIHRCRYWTNAKGLAWMGGDRFLVADSYPFRRSLDILEIAGRDCNLVGTFHPPGGGRIGGITYDPERELLFFKEADDDAIFALPLDPIDLDVVAITEPDKTVQCGIGSVILDAAGTCDPDENPLSFKYTWTTPDGDELVGSFQRAPEPPVGTYTYQLDVEDGRGNSDTDYQQVTVVDTRAPRIVDLSVSPEELWPPNGKLVPVEVDANVDEACDPEPRCLIVDVESSEPSREGVSDWEFRSDLEVALRAERDGDDDRIYTLTVECQDESGNVSSDTTQVRVPHNDPGSTCPCWSRAELKSIAPNPDTDSWLQTCKSGDDNLPDEDSIRRIQDRRGHLALAKSGSGPGEYRCQYVASFAPNVPFARNSRLVDEDAYEICRDQIRLRHTILGIVDECTTN